MPPWESQKTGIVYEIATTGVRTGLAMTTIYDGASKKCTFVNDVRLEKFD